MTGTGNISISEMQQRLQALEAESAIRRVVARYMELCDNLTPDKPLLELGSLFTKNAIWQGTGEKYKDTFGGHKGREEIVAFLASYCDPPHFSSNVHFLTSEAISVSGKTASGSWVMLQTPSFANGDSFVLAARLHLEFEYEDNDWRISNFSTLNLFGRPIKDGWHSRAAIPKPHKDQQP